MAPKTVEEARQEMVEAFQKVQNEFGRIHVALDKVTAAGPEDDLEELLEDLEDVVKKVRTGGVIGSGANGHTRARKRYHDMKEGKV